MLGRTGTRSGDVVIACYVSTQCLGLDVQQATAGSTKGSGSATYSIPTLTLCSLQGIGSGQSQLIAVTCIAEHA